MFQAVKNPAAHPTCLYSGLFWKFFGDFWVYLEIESSNSQRLKLVIKFMEIGNFEDLVVF